MKYRWILGRGTYGNVYWEEGICTNTLDAIFTLRVDEAHFNSIPKFIRRLNRWASKISDSAHIGG